MNYNTDIKCTTEESVQPNVQDTNQSPVVDDIDKGFTKLTGEKGLRLFSFTLIKIASILCYGIGHILVYLTMLCIWYDLLYFLY